VLFFLAKHKYAIEIIITHIEKSSSEDMQRGKRKLARYTITTKGITGKVK
jgi:hypothetical protein